MHFAILTNQAFKGMNLHDYYGYYGIRNIFLMIKKTPLTRGFHVKECSYAFSEA